MLPGKELICLDGDMRGQRGKFRQRSNVGLDSQHLDVADWTGFFFRKSLWHKWGNLGENKWQKSKDLPVLTHL